MATSDSTPRVLPSFTVSCFKTVALLLSDCSALLLKANATEVLVDQYTWSMSSSRRRFKMVLGDIADAICARISSLDAVRTATVACTVRRSSRAAMLHGRSSNVWMFFRPLLKTATYHWYIVPYVCSNPSICPSSFPQTYNGTSFKLRQEVQDAWDNLSHNDIRHSYDRLRTSIQACIAARGNTLRIAVTEHPLLWHEFFIWSEFVFI